MATYTITVNERTKAGKSLVNYLKSLGVIDGPNDETMPCEVTMLATGSVI